MHSGRQFWEITYLFLQSQTSRTSNFARIRAKRQEQLPMRAGRDVNIISYHLRLSWCRDVSLAQLLFAVR